MKAKQYLVIGAGRFGSALATTLYDLGHEVVIVDSPPLPLLSDAMTLAAHASGVIAVSAIGRTTQDGVREFLRVMSLHRGELLGVVANFAPHVMGGRAAQYYQRA